MFRAIVLLSLAGLLVLGSIEYGPAVMERLGVTQPASDADGSPTAALPGGADPSGAHWSDIGDAPSEEAAPTPRTTWRYFDGSGSLHFVDALEKVPEPYRASAKQMGSSELPQITRAETKRPRRVSTYERTMDGKLAARQRANASAPPPASRRRGASEVVVYSTSWCGWCRKTMAWLDERGVEYENRDIEKNDAWREELIEKTGRGSIPMVEIDGEVIQGFNPDRMGELL
jgi:glutaredoxin